MSKEAIIRLFDSLTESLTPANRPKGGTSYLYKYMKESKKEDWRLDGWRWRQSGSVVIHCGEISIRKIYFQVYDAPKSWTNKFSRFAYTREDRPHVVVVQYIGDERVAAEFQHGKATKKARSDIRIQTPVVKSEMDALRTATDSAQPVCQPILTTSSGIQVDTAKGVARNTEKNNNQNFIRTEQNQSWLTRDALYNLHEFAYNSNFVHHITIFPKLSVFLYDPELLLIFKSLLQPGAPLQQLSYDTTFNLGAFDLSVLLFRETEFIENPVIPLAYLIHQQTLQTSHDKFFQFLEEICPELGTASNAVIITNHESAIKQSIRAKFPTTRTFLCWNHVLQNQDFAIRIQLQKEDDLSGARLDGGWRLWQLIQPHRELIFQRLRNSSSLASFLAELKHLLESELSRRQHATDFVPLPKFYSELVADIESLGWNRISFVSSTFRELHLMTIDIKKRQHVLKLHLHQHHPEKSPEFIADLPVPFQFVWNTESKLVDVFSQFDSHVQQLQMFWNMLDEIDGSTCVLEPDKPTRSAAYRRIALGKNTSLQVDIDPRNPIMMPICRFLGADHVTGPLKERLNRNMLNWKPDISLLRNLQETLEVAFPSRETSKKEDFVSECGICYSYQLNEEIPDQSCDDDRCAQTFHNSCLCEWLRSLASTRQSFNMLFGECPYCGKSITVKIAAR